MKDFTRQNNHGGNDVVPALLDALLGAGIDVANDFVMVYDASTGNMTKTTIDQLFLAAGYAPSTPGAFDNVVIGAVTPLAGSFTALSSTSELVGTGTAAAAGADQAGAVALTHAFNVVSGADDSKGARLMAAANGKRVQVKNTVSNKILLLYPATGAKIDGAAANAALSIAAGVGVTLISDGTDWYTV